MNRHNVDQPHRAYVDANKKLIITHSSGFFSCCTIRLRKIINYYNEYLTFPVVDSSRQWSMYKDQPGDISQMFFNTIDIAEPPTIPVTFSTDVVEDQFSNYSMINFLDVGKFIKKYFSVSDDVKKFEEYLIQKYKIDVNNTIAVCYRGTDKKTETGIPTYTDIEEKIQVLKNQFPNHAIIIRCDETEFCTYMHKKYPDIIFFEELRTVPSNARSVQFYVPQGKKVTTAQMFLATTQIFSKCSHVILNSGNVGMWICLYRNSMTGVSQYLNTNDSKRYTINNWIEL